MGRDRTLNAAVFGRVQFSRDPVAGRTFVHVEEREDPFVYQPRLVNVSSLLRSADKK